MNITAILRCYGRIVFKLYVFIAYHPGCTRIKLKEEAIFTFVFILYIYCFYHYLRFASRTQLCVLTAMGVPQTTVPCFLVRSFLVLFLLLFIRLLSWQSSYHLVVKDGVVGPSNIQINMFLAIRSNPNPNRFGLRLPVYSGLKMFTLLLLAGDIQSNPGPRRCKYPCGICSHPVKKQDRAVCCDNCNQWVHNSCSGMSSHMYDILKGSTCTWICPSCGLPSFSSSFWSDSNLSISNSFSALSTTDDAGQFHPTAVSTPSKPRIGNKAFSNRSHQLRIISVNVNGLRGKTLQIHELISTHEPDIILCQETKLDASVNSSEIFPPDFTVMRKDRTCHGGGVCIAISNKIVCSHCTDLENDLEMVWLKFKSSSHDFVYLSSFYRPPDGDVNLTDKLREPLGAILDRHKNKPPIIIIAGDFNYPNINWKLPSHISNSSGQCLVNVLDDHHLQQLVTEPTRFGLHNSSVLDLVCCSHPSLIGSIDVGQEFSDHCLLHFSIDVNHQHTLANQRKVYMYKRGNYDCMRADFQQFSTTFFANTPDSSSVEDVWQQIKQFILKTVTNNVPSKLVGAKRSHPPWLTARVCRYIKRRDRLAAIAKKSGSEIDRRRFRKARNEVNLFVKHSYQDYLNTIIGNLHDDKRAFYRFIKNKKTDPIGIPPLKTSQGLLESDTDKANALNDYFSSVFTKENIKLFNLPCQYPDIPPIEVTSPGVVKLLSGLNVNKSTGPDDISPYILKETAHQLSPLLTYLFNRSLVTGEVPLDWRLANIFALHKKGAKDLPENYRPISLTSVLSKILEHIVLSGISNFLEKNNILTPRQHGFRPGHSCTTQLINVVDDLAKAVDDGHRTDVAIFDFSKAFDSVPHRRLLYKLQCYGIRGPILRWISSFLCHRQQRVVINGNQSAWLPVLSGVPQGTVLGPLLFLLYINDIESNISSEIRLFADDCILYRTIKSAADPLALQTDISKLQTWADTWQMKFNPDKCHILPIGRKRNITAPSYHLGPSPLTVVDSYTYLGITISSDLRWENHVTTVSAKATRVLNFVRRNIYGCTPDAKELAYTSLVRPLLEYATPAWDPYRAKDINKLEMVQRRAARFVKSDYRRTASVSKLLDDLGWSTLSDRRKESRLNMFGKAVAGRVSISVDKFTKPIKFTRSSDASTFTTISTRTDPYKYSFFPRTICDWNSLSAQSRLQLVPGLSC